MEEWQVFWAGVEAIGTLLGVLVTSLAVIVALFGEAIRAWFRRPRLRILPTESGPPDLVKIPTKRENQLLVPQKSGPPHLVKTTTAEADTYYLRVRVKNFGKVRAENVEVFAARLFRQSDGNFQEVPDFLPMTLKWAHRGPVLPDLSPESYRYCSVTGIFDPEKRSMFPAQEDQRWSQDLREKTLLSFSVRAQTNDKGYLQPPGIYHLELELTAANARSRSAKLEIMLSGDWYDDEQEMFSKGVTIRLIQ